MFRIFQQSPFQPPQYGDGMWPPLAYVIDFLGILAGIVLILSLLAVAWAIAPLIAH